MTKKVTQPLFRLRTIAIAEAFIAIGVLMLVNLFYFNGDRFVGINPHPFWFVVILISAQYGVTEGIFAVLVASAVFLIGNVRARGADEYFYSYLLDVNAQPLLWLISAVILGSLRFRHVMERDRLRKDLAEAFKREDTVAVHYEQLRVMQETLEQRLVKHVNTTVDTYKAAKLMETYHPGMILAGVEELVISLMDPKQFSVFKLNGDVLKTALTQGWDEKDKYMRTISANNRLFEEVIGNKRIVCVADEGDEQILLDQGMLAGPIMSDNGQILGMLKIENMNYADLHISAIQTFRILCTWIGNAYYQAHDFQKASRNSFINPVNNLYSYEYFKLQSDYTVYLGKRFNFDVMLMVVEMVENKSIDASAYAEGMEVLKKIVENSLRKIDQLFNYQATGHTFYLLLPGTAEQYGQVVAGKINAAFEETQKDATTKLHLSFSIQTLYTKPQA